MAARYRIIRKIGAGGMGRVYLAYDNVLEREVALKELHIPEHLSEEDRMELQERFQLEAKAAARLSHPHIVTVHDIIITKDFYFIVMEYLPGKTLGEIIKERTFTHNELLSIAPMICDALGYAHSHGVIHRDVKPDNILALENGNVKVTDFGIAKLRMSRGVTQTGSITGTPNYLAPELILNQPYDHRVDIFSLGTTFYELLTGSPPFDAENDYSILYKLVSEKPRPLLEICPDLPPSLVAVVDKALEKDPRDRFSDMQEMKEALMRVRLEIGLDASGQKAMDEESFSKDLALRKELESVKNLGNGELVEYEPSGQFAFHKDPHWRELIAQIYNKESAEEETSEGTPFTATPSPGPLRLKTMPTYEEANLFYSSAQKGRPAPKLPSKSSATLPLGTHQPSYQVAAGEKTSPGGLARLSVELVGWSAANIVLSMLVILSVELPWIKPVSPTWNSQYGIKFPEGIALIVLMSSVILSNSLLLIGLGDRSRWANSMGLITIVSMLVLLSFLGIRIMAGLGVKEAVGRGAFERLGMVGWGLWLGLISNVGVYICSHQVQRRL